MVEGARPAAALVAAALLTAAAATGCTEDPLTGPGPEEGEPEASETVELVLTPDQMEAWRDTSFTGFAVAADAPFLLLADRDSLTSRTLLRYSGFPDSVNVDDEPFAVEEFRDGVLRLVADTSGSVAPDGGMTLRVFTLGRPYDSEEATWERAAEGQPWDSAGGELDQEIGTFQVDQVTDSVMADTMDVPLGTVTDSLLRAWRDSGGDPGLAVLLEGAGGQLELTGASLEFDVKPAGRDTVLGLVAGSFFQGVPSTFVFDPPNPPPGSDLRVGGLPASRLYFAFRPPRTVDGVELTGGTVNRAEVVLSPLAAPPDPARFDGPVSASAVQLAADPFDLGPKTPIGAQLGPLRTLNPDSLAEGRTVRFPLTALMTAWASNPDSAGDLKMGLRLDPDVQSVGFWEFGSDGSGPDVQPILRIVVTPPSEFRVP